MLKHGYHYLTNTQSYRQADLDNWLPNLRTLKARWLVLPAPTNRAIPEAFLTALLENQIQPVIHFSDLTIGARPVDDLVPLFEAYARWGVQYLVLYDRPNLQKHWEARYWTQASLVETFLDQYLPLANAGFQAGLTPIFPPLEPGGDYWDTAFLLAALQGLRRRAAQPFLKSLIMGAYAQYQDGDLNWGAGGPERWPKARPYCSNPDTQDQRGFRIFDWYLMIAQAALNHTVPIFLFGLGPQPQNPISSQKRAALNLQMARLLAGEKIAACDALPQEIIGATFGYDPQIWFHPGQALSALAKEFCSWLEPQISTSTAKSNQHPINHYLLLPAYDWGVADFHLEAIRPFVKKYQPTVGFSVKEAAQAKRVTVIGGRQIFPEEIINELRAKGCIVERIEANGTELAPILAAL